MTTTVAEHPEPALRDQRRAPHGTSSAAVSSRSREIAALLRALGGRRRRRLRVDRRGARRAPARGRAAAAARSRPASARRARPVWPKPPSPRAVASRLATSSPARARATGAITSCAMRSPRRIVNGSRPGVQHDHLDLTAVVGVYRTGRVRQDDAVPQREPAARAHLRLVAVGHARSRSPSGPARARPARARRSRLDGGVQVEAGRAARWRAREAAGPRAPRQARDPHPHGAAAPAVACHSSRCGLRLRGARRPAPPCARAGCGPRGRCRCTSRAPRRPRSPRRSPSRPAPRPDG